MSRTIGFFATRHDLLDLLSDVELSHRIHYSEAGMFDSSEVATYASASQIQGLGTITVPDPNLGPHFLIADAMAPFTVQAVPQRRGGVRYAVDQMGNPDTVSLMCGGQFDDQTILAGSLGTCADSPVSAALLKTIARLIRRKWAKIKSYAVGPQARRLLDVGGRLTQSIGTPKEYDLQR